MLTDLVVLAAILAVIVVGIFLVEYFFPRRPYPQDEQKKQQGDREAP